MSGGRWLLEMSGYILYNFIRFKTSHGHTRLDAFSDSLVLEKEGTQ